jgi:hypothetical protein
MAYFGFLYVKVKIINNYENIINYIIYRFSTVTLFGSVGRDRTFPPWSKINTLSIDPWIYLPKTCPQGMGGRCGRSIKGKS